MNEKWSLKSAAMFVCCSLFSFCRLHRPKPTYGQVVTCKWRLFCVNSRSQRDACTDLLKRAIETRLWRTHLSSRGIIHRIDFMFTIFGGLHFKYLCKRINAHRWPSVSFTNSTFICLDFVKCFHFLQLCWVIHILFFVFSFFSSFVAFSKDNFNGDIRSLY